ncbi:hypothetical protein BZG36_00182 [Bifiguratus adelaidae]|uniref:Calmodulin n=1 Tax=Bifiguratus adelaidae TaxID=1938954 RepID=A0A261Y8A2_9FUNG|nr:hypothetical protein BZG36_00182 [Bifiguratus adelaidae]
MVVWILGERSLRVPAAAFAVLGIAAGIVIVPLLRSRGSFLASSIRNRLVSYFGTSTHPRPRAPRRGLRRTPAPEELAVPIVEEPETNEVSTTPTGENESEDRLGFLYELTDESEKIVSLMYSLVRQQSVKDGYMHRGITCNKCNKSPIRGVRYKCVNCDDFDLCEACESNKFFHNQTHLFLKIRIPIPPMANPRRALLPLFYKNDNMSYASLDNTKSAALQKVSPFDDDELEGLFEEFKSLASGDLDDAAADSGDGPNVGITKETFKTCLGPLASHQSLIIDQLFKFYDQDTNGYISFSEMICGLSILCQGTVEDRIKGQSSHWFLKFRGRVSQLLCPVAFQGYDLDNDGYITKDDVTRILKAYYYLSMDLVRDVVSGMEEDMMDRFEFNASQPVSAAFTGGIPNSSDSESETENAQARGSTDQPNPSTIVEPEKQASGMDEYFQVERQRDNTADDTHDTHDTTISNDTLLNGADETRNHSEQATTLKEWQEKYPIMETMSHEAIEEIVNSTFSNITPTKPGYISFEEFRDYALKDGSIFGWFEVLGTVF